MNNTDTNRNKKRSNRSVFFIQSNDVILFVVFHKRVGDVGRQQPQLQRWNDRNNADLRAM